MTPADLEKLEGAGVFSVVRPDDSAAADAFDAAMADYSVSSRRLISLISGRVSKGLVSTAGAVMRDGDSR